MLEKNFWEEKPNGVNAIIYSDSGAGKTWMVGDVKEKTLLIDMDIGAKVLRNHPNIEKSKGLLDIYQVSDFSVFDEFFDKLCLAGGGSYSLIILDTVSQYEKLKLSQLGQASAGGNAPTRADYNNSGYTMRQKMADLRNLTANGKNVLVFAWEMPLEVSSHGESSHTKAYPMLMKSVAPEVVGMFDIVGRLETKLIEDTGEVKRAIRLQNTARVFGKDRIFSDRKGCAADINTLLYGGKQHV